MKIFAATSTDVSRRVCGKNIWRGGMTLLFIVVSLLTPAFSFRGPTAEVKPLGLGPVAASSPTPPTPSPTPVPADDPTPPVKPVKLIYIQSPGDNWLANVDGGLGMALRDNNYFVSTTNDRWGPEGIGGRTNIGSWWEWFRGPDSSVYLTALYTESGKNLMSTANYWRLPTDPGGENEVIVLRSASVNSALAGTISDTVTSIDRNPLRGQDPNSEYHTLVNAKGIYLDLLNYFRQHPEKLFVVVTAAPLTREDTNPEEAANARVLNTWLVTEWLKDYPYPNVVVFDLFNVLTSPANHHRYLKTKTGGKVEYVIGKPENYYAKTYINNSSYPFRPGNQAATAEFVPLLNVYYNRWQREMARAPAPTAAATPLNVGGWSAPLPMPGFGWFPDVAVDSNRQVHVVWSSSSLLDGVSYDVVQHSASADGQNWGPVDDIAALPQDPPGNGEVTRPALLADPRGVLHLTFRAPLAQYSQAPVDQAGEGSAWRIPEQMNTSNWAYFSRLALDRKGRLHFIFTENLSTSSCAICYHLYYRRSEDDGQTWSTAVDISRQLTGAAKPQMLIDDQDVIHIVWEAGRGGTLGHVTNPAQVEYMASYDGGETWTSPVAFKSPAAQATDSQRNIALGQDGQGNLVAVWLGVSEDRIYFQVSNDRGRTWSGSKLVPEVWGAMAIYPSMLDDYTLATDSAGVLHLVMVGRTYLQQSLSILHLTWNGTEWSLPERLITYRGDVPEWPQLAIGGGNRLHVVWFVRNEADIWSGGGDYRIWYTQSQLSAPAATPVMVPTFSSMPTRGVTTLTPPPIRGGTPTGSATRVVPAVDPTLAVIGQPVYSEQDYLLIIATGLLPVLLILGVLLAGAWLWRRR